MNLPTPFLFQLRQSSPVQFPKVSVHFHNERLECPACGGWITVDHPETGVTLIAEGGRDLPHFLELLGKPHLLAQHSTVPLLKGLGSPPHQFYPVKRVVRKSRTKTLLSLKPSTYVLVIPGGRVRWDKPAMGWRESRCEVCGSQGRPHERIPESELARQRKLEANGLRFEADSRSGGGLYTTNAPRTGVFCDLQFLELVRRHGWSGLEFEAADSPPDLHLSWDGIDVHGPLWPPAWYPPAMSDPRTPEAWVASYVSASVRSSGPKTRASAAARLEWHRAIAALLWLGPKVLAPLAKVLEHSDGRIRYHAAGLMESIINRRGARVPATTKRRMREVLAKTPRYGPVRRKA